MFKNILIICIGNICRSPFAEFYLKSKLPNKVIKSAGIQASINGRIPDFSRTLNEQKYHLNMENHKATMITKKMIHDADLILVMEKFHISLLCDIDPQSRGKIFLLGQWINKEIPDPYRQHFEAFEYSYNLIIESCDSWIKRL